MEGLKRTAHSRLLWALCTVFLLASTASGAESWGMKMFPVKRHNFGRVALLSQTEYKFEIKNIWEQEVRIVGVHSSCTCTEVSASANKLGSLETGHILAKLNTSGTHTKNVGATLSVQLELRKTDPDSGAAVVLQDVVQLEVKGYIRPDVLLTPGLVEFGTVPEGKSVSRSVRLEYAGKSDWGLTRILKGSPYVHARAEEVKRANGEVVYDVLVTLNRRKDAPEGYIKDILRFVTNETPPGQKEPTSLTLPIQGEIVAPLQAKPSPFLIGILRPGERVTKNIVVRNNQPFKIQSVTASDKRFRFTFSDRESPVHLISVLFAAGPRAEDEGISQKIFVRTNLDGNAPITIDVQGRVFAEPAPVATGLEVRSMFTDL